MSDKTNPRRIPCSYCGAKVDEPCVRRLAWTGSLTRDTAIKHYGPTGRASYPHAARQRPLNAAWLDGWGEALRFAAKHPEAFARMVKRRANEDGGQ